MSKNKYIRCETCNAGKWVEYLSEPCPDCGNPLGKAYVPGIAIQCVWFDRLNENSKKYPTGYHSGIGEFVTSKRDLIEKSKRKGLSVSFDY